MPSPAVNLPAWVDSAPSTQREFRQAIFTILTAITSDIALQQSMVMKGGVLIAIRYQSHRYTTDLDFSTPALRADFDLEDFRLKFEQSLARVVADSPYDMDCRVQGCRMSPKKEDSKFSSVEMKIAYAPRGSSRHRHLLRGFGSTTVKIDFSLNEQIFGVESLELGPESNLQAYKFTELVAEKFRALLQQSVRNRFRRQDPYDLRWLIESEHEITDTEKSEILECLILKARSRGITPRVDSIDDPELKRRAKAHYQTLSDEVPGELPDFEESYDIISDFYRKLPWPQES